MANAILTRRYTPARGYIASVRRHVAPLDYMTGDSRNWLLSTNEGKATIRLGSTFVGEADVTAPVGLLEANWRSTGPAASLDAHCRHIFSLKSTSLDDGYPTVAALWGNDDSRYRYGQLVIRSTNSGLTQAQANHVLGEEFSATHYPSSGAASTMHWRVMPMIAVTRGTVGSTEAILYHRGTIDLHRRFMFSGSRRVVETAEHVYFPNRYGMPLKWNKKWNDTTSAGSNITEIAPWGHLPPLFPPSISLPSPSTSNVNWNSGDTFYIAVAFIRNDGSVSMPYLPQPQSAGAATAALHGLVTVGTIGSANKYQTITVSNIAKGPPGTRARLLLVSPLDPVVAAGQTLINAQPGDLRIARVINNNTQTSVILGSIAAEGALRIDPLLVRFDHLWCPSARYAAVFEHRYAVGYHRFPPAAIVIAPTGSVASRDLNLRQDEAIYGSVSFHLQIQSGSLRLRKTSGGITTTTAFTLNSSRTLQTVVDEINETLTSTACGEWAAQVVPGVDPFTPSDQIALSDMTFASNAGVAGAPGSNQHSTDSSGSHRGKIVGSFTDVAIGMSIAAAFITGTGYVIAKESDTTIIVGDATGARVTLSGATDTFETWCDTGDDGLIQAGTGVRGNMRAFAPTFPAFASLKGSYLATLQDARDGLFFTIGSPGTAQSAADSFVNNEDNRRTGAGLGDMVGAAAVQNGLFVGFTDGVKLLANIRGGTTGDDADYRMYPVNQNRGVIAWDAWVSGDNWVGYMTAEGYVVADFAGGQTRERLISMDLHDPAPNGRSILSYEIGQSAAAVRSDAEGAHFHAMVEGTRIHLTYRSSASVSYPDFRSVYDFSQGAEASGIGEVLKPDGTPYGWSAPLAMSSSYTPGAVTAMGWVRRSDGVHLYGAWEDDSLPSGASGLLIEMETGGYDAASRVSTAHAITYSSGVTTLTGVAGDFADFAVGAIFKGNTDVTNGTTVLTRSDDASSVTISAATTGAGTATLIAYGGEVRGTLYFATDQCDSIRNRKRIRSVAPLYKTASGILRMTVSRDAARASQVNVTLDDTGSLEQDSGPVKVPLAVRGPGKVLEMGFTHDGGGSERPEVWGIEAEVEVLNTRS